MNKLRKISSLLMAILLLGISISGSVKADTSWQYRSNRSITVNGNVIGQIPALENDYDNNLFLSLRGIAYALRDTNKAFAPESIERRLIKLVGKSAYGETPAPWSEEQLGATTNLILRRNQLFLGDVERKYSSYTLEGPDGKMDAFLSPLSLALLFDMEVQVEENGISISTGTPFERTIEDLEQGGYLQGINALVLGDATTGDLFYAYGSSRKVAIASTTKLMTYFVTMDAVSAGECGLSDKVTVSGKAQRLSESADGSTPLVAGQKIPLIELLYGLLLPSSNECGLAIAEHVSGTMEAFVGRMNEKAAELGMEDTHFINCHGLPVYEANTLPAKVQNQMTAQDMFTMATALVTTYPEVMEITSTKSYKMETLNQVVKNTNAVLYNVPEVKGLKTGYTNRAGSCLVQCIPLELEGETHNIITVLFGAEEDVDTFLISEIVARYVKKELPSLVAEAASIREALEAQATLEEREWAEESVPENPELVIQKLIKLNCK